LTVTATGAVTITDSSGTVMAQGTLAAVADTSYLYGGSPSLTNPCYGLFTFQSTDGHSLRKNRSTRVGYDRFRW
jgi:hypothetical protein